MKNLSFWLFFVIVIIPGLSCNRNRLKTNEKNLAKEILVKEKENLEAERIAREKNAEIIKSKSGSLRQREIRSVDPQNPPIRIDIPGKKDNIRKFKLSDVASSVRYIKLQTPPDTILLYEPFFSRNSLMSNIISDGENIIIQGVFGLTRFNMQGEYQETIWKNETGISLSAGGVGFGGKDFFGVLPYIPVSLFNGNLYYSFQDGPSGNDQVMKYKPGSNRSLSVSSHSELPGQSTIPGDTLLNTKKTSWYLFDKIFGIGSDSWVGIHNKWDAGKSGSLLVTYNNKDDTLCQFTDYDRIVNFSHGNYRTHAKLTSYYFNELVTIKPEYNDTVFRLIPPNRLLPVYVIDFGEYKVNYMDGLNPDFDLSEKYMLYSIHETNNLLFLRFTKNHDGTTNRKKNAVKFYNTIFDKKAGKIYHQPGFTLSPENILNDIDGGMPFWPDFITPQGEMMKLVSGKIIKDYVNSEEFNKADISKENRRKQISLASGLRATDMVIVIVK
jgi:hypothetical protein